MFIPARISSTCWWNNNLTRPRCWNGGLVKREVSFFEIGKCPMLAPRAVMLDFCFPFPYVSLLSGRSRAGRATLSHLKDFLNIYQVDLVKDCHKDQQYMTEVFFSAIAYHRYFSVICLLLGGGHGQCRQFRHFDTRRS